MGNVFFEKLRSTSSVERKKSLRLQCEFMICRFYDLQTQLKTIKFQIKQVLSCDQNS